MVELAIKGAKQPPKSARSRMDTFFLTPKMVDEWLSPPFQRPLKINEKVRTIAEALKHNSGVIDGVLTLGELEGEKGKYLLDGQHRIAAFKISELKECIADVRICTFSNLAEMGDEFVKLNSSIVKMNPDDVLRAMEGTIGTLHNIKEGCKFVGYENIRRGPKAAVLSMSAAIRAWAGSGAETPKQNTTAAITLAKELDASDAQDMIKFLNIAWSAWGNEPQNNRLWTALNLTMCMWMYRKLVIEKQRGVKRYVVLNQDLFKKCLLSVAASSNYVDWLVGRSMSERDRGPCYLRLKSLFVTRLKTEMHDPRPMLPSPVWAGQSGTLQAWGVGG